MAGATGLSNFTIIESVYGRFIVNRHSSFQAESLIKTGHPHIRDELETILELVEYLPEGCVVVDAGANIGLVTIPFAQAILPRGGVVHAFEVQRMMCYALCGTVALNDLENVVVHHKALGAAVGAIAAGKLDYSQPQDFGQFSLLDKVKVDTQQVEVVTIDSLGLPRLDFIKIDVEGMEIDVLRGARDSIARYLPWGWIEYWKVDVADIKAQFNPDEYKFYIMDQLNMLCAPAGQLERSGISIEAPEA
jgi:FkbM family methyltransferase